MSCMSLVFFKKYHVSLFSTPPCTSFAARTLSPQHTSLPLHTHTHTHTHTTVAIAPGSTPTSSLSRHLALYSSLGLFSFSSHTRSVMPPPTFAPPRRFLVDATVCHECVYDFCRFLHFHANIRFVTQRGASVVIPG